MKVKKIFGKRTEILAVKKKLVENFKTEIQLQQEKRTQQVELAKVRVTRCPVCGAPDVSKMMSVISGIGYLECDRCAHMFTERRLSEANLHSLYAETAFNQAEYLDGETAHVRLQQIYLPKAEFIINYFSQIKQRKPVTLLDVGAGSGGFVNACRIMGLSAEGIEPDAHLRRAARDQYGIELSDMSVDDMVIYGNKRYDIVTLWGVLEHVADPTILLAKAINLMHQSGWVVGEVPRGKCISTLIQTCFPERIIRHLDPVSHIHLFSEQSIDVMLKRSGLHQDIGWFFGMDAYELLLQMCCHFEISIDRLNQRDLSWFVDKFQNVVDNHSLSDAICWCASLSGDPK